MRKTLLFITLILISATIFSQNDAEARRLLEKSEQAFVAAGAVSAYFTVSISDDESQNTNAFDGTIFIKNEKYKIDAPEFEVCFDGTTQWVYNKSANEVNITEPEADEVQTLNPSMIYNLYKKNCNCQFSGKKTDNKMRKVAEVKLTPKGKKQDIKEVTLQINEKDNLPVYIFAKFKNNGLENEIFINKYSANQSFDDSLFVFDPSKYEDIEVIDLR